ncbi:hypothetical protein AF335_09275 [Streptomyces eurocidicus]|uniref:Uncharacterized protein n=1 Tax=Streptomyces eurocidicus TaxID=66423 RepID=A0A2N8P0Z6_STREU|nr:hypothetical protein AF335_09275 [Streptomyces eurocidicus]
MLPAASQPQRADAAVVDQELTQEQVPRWRNRAAADHQIVHDHIVRYSERSAQRLFTRAFVATVQRLSRLGHLDLGYTPWGQARTAARSPVSTWPGSCCGSRETRSGRTAGRISVEEGQVHALPSARAEGTG